VDGVGTTDMEMAVGDRRDKMPREVRALGMFVFI
jgi:hypothetical protein